MQCFFTHAYQFQTILAKFLFPHGSTWFYMFPIYVFLHVSPVSTSVSTSVSTGGQGDPLEVGATHGSRSRPSDPPGAGGVSQDDQWQDPEESVEDLWRQRFLNINR